MKKVRLALIGAGRWGKNIIKTLDALPECELAYQATHDWRTLLEKSDIDGVLIATPTSTHAEIALPFIERGLPVFIEKPFTTSLADAKRLQKAAEESGSIIFVGHLHLYNPPYLAIKKLLPTIGRVRWIYAEGANNGPYRDDMSALWDWAPHDIALMLDMLGSLPLRVQAFSALLLRPAAHLDDIAFIKLEFPNRAVGFIFNSWLFPEKRKKVSIIGKKSSIVFDDTAEKKIALYEHMGPEVAGNAVTRNEPSISYPPYGDEKSLALELKAFLRTILEKEKPLSGVAEGLDVVAVLDAAERSISAGGTVIAL
ncbi:MAG: Gfo/Idh/MocA family oxidoreductase [Patescibacteria group bacterium]